MRSVCCSVLMLVLAACEPTPFVRGNACYGDRVRWVSGGTLAVNGIHAAMLPNGLAIVYGYSHVAGHAHTNLDGGRQLWDPVARAPVAGGVSISNHNPFCAGQSILGDGRLMVAGGFKDGDLTRRSTADRVATIRAGAASAEWVDATTTMTDYRWYPTVVTLADGSALIMGGSDPDAFNNWRQVSTAYELFDVWQNRLIRRDETERDLPRDGDFDFPDDDMRQMIDGGGRLAGLYPLTHLLPRVPGDDAPDGLLFVLNESFLRLYNPVTNTIIGTKQLVNGFRTWWTQASSVLLPIDIDEEGRPPGQVRIMVVGGGTTGRGDGEADALKTAEVFVYDVTSRSLAPDYSQALQRPRIMGDALLLPDGNVLVVGGAEVGYANSNSRRVRHAELIQPRTMLVGESTQQLLPAPRGDRGYHASALLLPDASVMTTGGTGYWASAIGSGPPEEHKTVEIFEPPYMSAGPRPQILSSTEQLHIGGLVQVTTNEVNVKDQIVLVRLGARTHSLDTDQRLVRLAARRTVNANGTITLTGRLPSESSWVPPGPYYLFVLRHCTETSLFGAVPSRAKIVSLRLAEPPDATTNRVRITIRTGKDDLRTGNRAVGFFVVDGGVRTPEFALNDGVRWEPNSTHAVDATLPSAFQLRRIDQLGIRMSDDGDDWNIDSIALADPQSDGSFRTFYSTWRTPVVRLTETTNWTLSLP
jgi:hypothetical protein